MARYPITMGSLPNEILMNIFSLFPTRSLLPLTLTSRRSHDIILRIIHNRLLAAASLADYKVILECYHPSAKSTTPYYICEYLGTDSLEEDPRSHDNCTLGKLHGLYSHFKPIQPEGDRKVWAQVPTRGWRETTLGAYKEYTGALVSQDLDLESYEMFSQLQADVSMVKVGPAKGFFLNCITISEGLMRVWRNWLGEQSKETLVYSPAKPESNESSEKRLLWSSLRENTGLRLRVQERKSAPAPPVIRQRADEDDTVSYTLQYEELVVRTSQLLLQVEESLAMEDTHQGTVCGLDGVHLSEMFTGSVGDDSKVVWRPQIEAF